jgi:hypothetical protein
MNLAPYRKFVIAFAAAAVTIAQAFGVANADEISKQVVAVFDAVAAIGIYAVPNEPAA